MIDSSVLPAETRQVLILSNQCLNRYLPGLATADPRITLKRLYPILQHGT